MILYPGSAAFFSVPVITSKSFVVIVPLGNVPSQTPATEVTATRVNVPLLTPAETLLKVGSVPPGFEYLTISPTLTRDLKLAILGDVTAPPLVIVKLLLSLNDCVSLSKTRSAANVLLPVTLCTDFTSAKVKSSISVTFLPTSSPLISNGTYLTEIRL